MAEYLVGVYDETGENRIGEYRTRIVPMAGDHLLIDGIPGIREVVSRSHTIRDIPGDRGALVQTAMSVITFRRER